MMKFFFLILISLPAFAAQPTFRIMVRTKYDMSWYKITQFGKLWVCETKHVPYFETRDNPLANLNWSALEKEGAIRPKKCRNTVGMQNVMDGKEKTVVTCLTQKETLSLYEKISSKCRSTI